MLVLVFYRCLFAFGSDICKVRRHSPKRIWQKGQFVPFQPYFRQILAFRQICHPKNLHSILWLPRPLFTIFNYEYLKSNPSKSNAYNAYNEDSR